MSKYAPVIGDDCIDCNTGKLYTYTVNGWITPENLKLMQNVIKILVLINKRLCHYEILEIVTQMEYCDDFDINYLFQHIKKV